MHTLLEQLLSDGPVVTDGAWGTQLQARGLSQGASPDAWNLEFPERVEEVPRAYVAAGSRVVLTNTFQANRLTLAGHGLDGQCQAINRAGVEISRRAAGDRVRVFASIGPSGKMLFMGQVTAEELSRVFQEQADALAKRARTRWCSRRCRTSMRPNSRWPPPRGRVCRSWPAWFSIAAKSWTVP